MTRASTISSLLLSSFFLLGARCAADPRSISPAVAELQRDEMRFLIREGAAWIAAQRELHRPDARRLTPEEKRRLAGFFSPEILDVARVKEVRAIENPAFFEVYEDAGRPLPLDFSRASGLALLDTILVVQSPRPLSSPSRMPLLFHELVHVVQDRILGDRYLEVYVRSWDDGGRRYRSIAHEDQAFELQSRFRADPTEVFSVEDEVRRRFAAELDEGAE